MDNSNVKVSLLFDRRRAKKTNKFPIKLTVYFKGQKKRYNSGIDVNENEWRILNSTEISDNNLKLSKKKLNRLIAKAEYIINELLEFSFEVFEKRFLSQNRIKPKNTLKCLFDNYKSFLENEDRIGSAISYNTTYNSLATFRQNPLVSDITKEFLLDYEKFMFAKGSSPSTIGIYLRQLRCILNIAIKKKLLASENYPFKDYNIPGTRNIKKAMSSYQIKSLFGYQTTDMTKRRAVDFWIFTYLSNGINMTDICYLKPENLDSSFFHYFRRKTINTKKRDLRPIKVPLTRKSWEIIERWRNKDGANTYLFPILENGLTARQAKYRIQKFLKKINMGMKIVASELGIYCPVGTYSARHSHATVLKNNGVPTEVIKENFGHASILTTEIYLSDFEDKLKTKYAKVLTQFN